MTVRSMIPPVYLAEMAAGRSAPPDYTPTERGVVSARNAGVATVARSRANLDSDDLAYPQRFEHQLAYLREHPNV